MSPDAAEIFAQVNAALLIALVVEGKAGAGEPSEADGKRAAWYAAGLYTVFLALAVTLSSVTYDKALSPWTSRIVGGLTFVGCFSLFSNVMDDLQVRARANRRRFLQLFLLLVVGTIWYAIWAMNFAPDFWPWQWF
jgi:hypothetical protein